MFTVPLSQIHEESHVIYEILQKSTVNIAGLQFNWQVPQNSDRLHIHISSKLSDWLSQTL